MDVSIREDKYTKGRLNGGWTGSFSSRTLRGNEGNEETFENNARDRLGIHVARGIAPPPPRPVLMGMWECGNEMVVPRILRLSMALCGRQASFVATARPCSCLTWLSLHIVVRQPVVSIIAIAVAVVFVLHRKRHRQTYRWQQKSRIPGQSRREQS